MAVNVHMIVNLMVSEMEANGWTFRTLEEVSGVSRGAVQRWKKGGLPNLYSTEAVLNTLGYDLLVLRRQGPVPKPPREAYAKQRKAKPAKPPKEKKPRYTGPRKLTQEQVDQIRSGELKGSNYAKMFGVSTALISQIRRGKRWPEPASRA
jgi:transcriptional regulator with XRE-family HTH domain